jgi:hypothetical protein
MLRFETLYAQIRHPSLKRMFRLWDTKRGDRRWPLRHDLDPCEFSFILGYVTLLDVIAPADGRPRRFYFRVDGTKQAELFGMDCTGKFLDQAVSVPSSQLAEESYNATIDSGEPQYRAREIEFRGRFLQYEIILLPMSRDGSVADMLMTVVMPETR